MHQNEQLNVQVPSYPGNMGSIGNDRYAKYPVPLQRAQQFKQDVHD